MTNFTLGILVGFGLGCLFSLIIFLIYYFDWRANRDDHYVQTGEDV